MQSSEINGKAGVPSTRTIVRIAYPYYFIAVPVATWQLSTTCPPEWTEWVRTCDGGVFHTPAGLLVDAPAGTPLYGRLVNASDDTVGVALGIRHGCRLATTERHVHLPTLPALAPASHSQIDPPIDPLQALESLKRQLKAMGVAEVTIGSYDATYTPLTSDTTPARLEYVVPISPSRDPIASLKTTHRRHVRRGERDGWTVQLLYGTDAESAILGVQESTAERATARAHGFAPVQSTQWARGLVELTPFPDHGLAVFAAYHDTQLLASVLVGWAATRSFYLIGGSTPAGYQCGAAVWLHIQVINRLVQHGIHTYNLGGTAINAAQETNPGHGLYRFKTGFGIEPVVRQGVHWILHPGHLRLHHLLTQAQHSLSSLRNSLRRR